MENVPVNLTTKTEWLFYHLWKKSPKTNQSCEGILIPSTVFFRWAHPHVWYRTRSDNKIFRMKNEKINIDDIYVNFNQNTGPSQIVSTYTYKDIE